MCGAHRLRRSEAVHDAYSTPNPRHASHIIVGRWIDLVLLQPSEQLKATDSEQPSRLGLHIACLLQRAAVDVGSLRDAQAIARLITSARSQGERAAPGPTIGDDLSLEELERLHIQKVLDRCGGNKAQTARILGIERKSLYRKAERLGIVFNDDD